MSQQTISVAVHLAGNDYRFACSPAEREELLEAAHYLDRSPQTLRIWKCNGTGLVRPLNILGRLAWPTAEVKRAVLGVN